MVSRCVNPTCKSESWLLNSGDLYALERRDMDTEFFWLCSGCGAHYQLVLDEQSRVKVQPILSDGVRHRQPPTPDARLRMIARPVLSKTRQERHLSSQPGPQPDTAAHMRRRDGRANEAA